MNVLQNSAWNLRFLLLFFSENYESCSNINIEVEGQHNLKVKKNVLYIYIYIYNFIFNLINFHFVG